MTSKLALIDFLPVYIFWPYCCYRCLAICYWSRMDSVISQEWWPDEMDEEIWPVGQTHVSLDCHYYGNFTATVVLVLLLLLS